MSAFQIIALLVSLTALLSYVNHRFIKAPTTIGVMLIALLLSFGFMALGWVLPAVRERAAEILSGIPFNEALMQGMLSFLLFAGALQIDLEDLLRQKWTVLILSLAGVALSTAIVGVATFYMLDAAHIGIGFWYCMLFGALISPTDPIAVISILKTAGIPRSLETKIASESLFNDGLGVVAFAVLYGVAVDGESPSAAHIGRLFLQESVGGAVIGLLFGWVLYRLLKTVDNYQVEILLTLAFVTGGYAAASAAGASGPIAIVVGGLFIGNHGRRHAMSESTREHLDLFWELIDEILNAVLFVLIGLEFLVIAIPAKLLLAGAAAIPLILVARWISVALPLQTMKLWRTFTPGAASILTWGGLRGGISIALALSIPRGPQHDTIMAMTYIVVVFSVLVQGLTIRRVAATLMARDSKAGAAVP